MIINIAKRMLEMALGAAIFILPLNGHAATHIVQFGGSLGLAYSPASFSAHVGDTVTWEGDFAVHPLSSTSVPSGAATWHNGSGSTFSYAIKVAGTYNYQCDVHVSSGMTGTFSATSSTVLSEAELIKNGNTTVRVFSSGERTFVRLSVQSKELISGTLYALDGKKLAAFANTLFGPGVYTLPLQNAGQGLFVLRIFAGKQEIFKNIL